MKEIDNVILQLTRHEGFRAKPYYCTAKKLTVGYGRNLDDNELTSDEKIMLDVHCDLKYPDHAITKQQAVVLLVADIKKIEVELNRRRFFKKLDEPRKGVLINMAFNLGVSGMMAFKKMVSAIIRGEFEEARDEMLDSRWANQVPNRANELAEQMLTGKW